MIDRTGKINSIRSVSEKEGEGLEGTLNQLRQAVVMRDCKAVKEMTEKMVKEEVNLFQILNHGLIPGMLEANERFRRGEFFIPELLMSSRALKFGLNVLRPLIHEHKKNVLGRVIIGTVKYDLHDIGKNLVIILLEGNGFEIIDLGVDVSPEKFVKAVEKNDAKLLMMSSLLTSTMSWMKFTIDLLHATGLKRKVQTMVGGAPVTPIFAKNIGADGYCREATSAPSMARKLLGVEGDE
ncbi:MAG: cobalamin-binding protein [Deltaproteobacteria bacterium]|nr:cobalamin-binding protein [Deltaproteobacteria bacterium]